MTRNELITAIHKGALTANRTYSKWAGGAWINEYGVEGYMVAEICRAIQRVRKNGYLTMEEAFTCLIESTGKRPRGRKPAIMQGTKRVDIALWNAEEYVTHVIEVKRLWNEQCRHDLNRIEKLQRKLGTIQCGLFVMLVVAKGGKKQMTEKAEEQITNIMDYLCDCPSRVHRGGEVCPHQRENGWTASTVCVELYGRN